MARTILENIVIQQYKEQSFFSFCEYTSIRFFEILYFEKGGSGSIKINGKTVSYGSNSFFVFVPDDIYIVEPETATSTIAIKFLKSFFRNTNSQNQELPVNDWFRKIEEILNSESHQLREMQFETTSDRAHLVSLVNMVATEYLNTQTHDIFIIQNSLSVILHLIARNIQYVNASEVKAIKSSKIQQIINYIHSNIYNPELLTTKSLANEFHMADNYISEYFKKHTDVSLKKYIINYKLKLVETRLKYTDAQDSEIALDLGFTDSSHLNKTFKTYKGISLSAYKASL